MQLVPVAAFKVFNNKVLEDLPEDWVCPVCGADKSDFEPAE